MILHQGTPHYPACTGTNVPNHHNQSVYGKLTLHFAPYIPDFEDCCSRLPYAFSHSSDRPLASSLRAGGYDLHLISLEPVAASTLSPDVFGVY